MAQTTSPIQIIFGLLLLCLLGWLLWLLGTAFWFAFKTFAERSPTVAAPVATGALTLLGAVTAVVVGRYFERKKEAEIAQRQKRIEVFESASKLLLDLLLNNDEPNNGRDFAAELRTITPKIILWAKPNSFTAYKMLVIPMRSENASLEVKMHSLEDFLLALRKDLDLSNSGLKKGDILRLIIVDYDATMSKIG